MRAPSCKVVVQPSRSRRVSTAILTSMLIVAHHTTASGTEWRQGRISGTMNADSCWLYLYTSNTVAPVYIDDLYMCMGTKTENGPNLIANPGFESGTNGWDFSGNFAGSSLTATDPTRGSAKSLLLKAASPVASGGSGNSVKQNVLGLSNGATHTLSFWYLATNSVDFVARYSGHSHMTLSHQLDADGTIPYGSIVSVALLNPDTFRLTWMAHTGQTYRVMNRLNLSSGGWAQAGMITTFTQSVAMDLPLAGTNGYFALLKAELPSVNNAAGATAIGSDMATLNGMVTSTGNLPSWVALCWDFADKGTVSPGDWTHIETVGYRAAGPFSATASGFGGNNDIYYRAFASNHMGGVFASSVATFTKAAQGALPSIQNTTDSIALGMTSATIGGNLTSTGSQPTSVFVCWDTSDKGTASPASWAHVEALGIRTTGRFSVVATDFGSNSTFYYRSYASNGSGGVFAPTSDTFTRSSPPTPAELSARTNELATLASTNDFGSRYGATLGLYQTMKSDDVLEHMQNNYQIFAEDLVSLAPSNAEYRIALGEFYLYLNEGEKAAEAFNAAYALPALSQIQIGRILNGLASASFLNNDRASAITYCENLVSSNYSTDSQQIGKYMDPVGQAKFALQYMKGLEVDYLQLPWDTDAKPFPTPQQATYSSTFVSLSSVSLLLGGSLQSDDLRVVLLTNKLDQFGVSVSSSAPFAIKINTEPAPLPPSKPEGYALFITNNSAIINSYDTQGTLWGIVSLIQMIERNGGPKIRIANVIDYPNTARRGFLQDRAWLYTLEYMLFCKLNTVVDQNGGPQVIYHDPLLPITPLQKEINKARSETYTELGLDLYYGIVAWTMWYTPPYSSERTFNIQYEICADIAKNGGHIYFPFDDTRFPLNSEDASIYGTAANLDANYLTSLYRAVKQQSPGFKLLFCPPFYWGPDGGGWSSYGEDRDTYLQSLGNNLDPEIDVFWTGPYVKGYTKTPSQVAWYTNLIGRKPTIYQNGTAPHNTLSYITDETPGWITWHYDGFLTNDIACFLKNAQMKEEAPQTTTLADCLWNVSAYDASNSIRRGCATLYGKNMFDILDPANKAIGYLDKYPYGETVTPAAVAELHIVEQKVSIAEAAVNAGFAYNGHSLSNFPAWLVPSIGWYKNFVVNLKKVQAVPFVDNTGGATSIGTDSAILNGYLWATGALPTSVSICWGFSDQGTNSPGNWAHVQGLGIRGTGAVSVAVSGFGTNTTIFYRCHASNSFGNAFSTNVTSFIKAGP